MRIENPNDYKLIGYELGTGNHKYAAILENKKTRQRRKIQFGAKGYQHYYDKLGHYSNLNHGDKKRRGRYHARHSGDKDFKFSSGYFAAKILW